MMSALSVPRPERRCASASSDGGKTKIPSAAGKPCAPAARPASRFPAARHDPMPFPPRSSFLRCRKIAMHLGPLKKITARDLRLKIRHADKVVFATIKFTAAWRTCRVGNRQADARIVFKKQTNQRGFSGARRCADDIEIACHARLFQLQRKREDLFVMKILIKFS